MIFLFFRASRGNFPRLAQSRQAKRKGVLGEGNFCPPVCPAKQDCGFCPPPQAAGSQRSASGFSRKKVRILTKRHSHLVKFAFPASLGASPLASANEFSSNFQTSQSFFSPEGRTQSGNFLPRSDYKFLIKTI